MSRLAIPQTRVRRANTAPLRADRDYVLYWMIAQRRSCWNFALQHAIDHARELRKPLVVFEALRCGHRWASDRSHRFVVDGMRDNAADFARAGVAYYPYVEPAHDAGRGLLQALAARATVVLTDEFPCFFLPRMVAAAATKLDVRLEVVDGNGIVPLATTPGAFTSAYAFRRFLHANLRPHLEAMPQPAPLRGVRLPQLSALPSASGAADGGAAASGAADSPTPWAGEIALRWPPATAAQLRGDADALAGLPIDHGVSPASRRGGSVVAARALDAFVAKIARYADEHSQPEADVTSGLSPYLHFGHVSAHAVVRAVLEREDWTRRDLSPRGSGQRQGWWGTSAAAEAFLDQVVTWRELGYVFNWHRRYYDRWESLPDWARATLDAHRSDPRQYVYDLDALTTAQTHDALWNAAQTQLVREGRIHNYMRMLWGKKIVEWSPSPDAALEVMIELNNRFAVDGRNPNSYSGIAWVLGRFDRPWAPQRPIFGVVRWMSSDNTARKLRVRDYVRRWSPALL